MRFATRMLVLQVLSVAAVTAVCAGIFLAIAVEQLKTDAENSALSIARTVAAMPEVRSDVARQAPGPDDTDALARGPLQEISRTTTERTRALFVVITDDEGTRLAHPKAARLGETVSTDYSAALAGREVVAWERGTLGESARAKVPVYPPEGGRPIGEVSVGFERAGVFDDLPTLILGVAAASTLALGIGVLTAFLVRRRLERLTLGLQPEELTALVGHQAAVVEGVSDGVIAVDQERLVRVCNDEAARLLNLDVPLGHPIDELELPPDVLSALDHPGPVDGIVCGDRVLYLDAHPVLRRGRPLGTVLILRDRTDLLALSERLDSVRSMTQALRVQRHEFANRMHVATGLLDAGRDEEARDFLSEMSGRGPVDTPLAGAHLLQEPFLESFLGAKALEAAERDVALALEDDTLVLGAVTGAEDVATVLGNLIDNAVQAASSVSPGRVLVSLMDSGSTLVVTVADSGPGIPDGVDIFGASTRWHPDESGTPDAVHGHGIGLRLCRELIRRRGGELWVIQASGGALGGAMLGARLPGVMDRASREPGEGEP